jgi:hypothetical protein
MKYRIRPYSDMTGKKGFFVQRKPKGWFHFIWDTVCVQYGNTVSVMVFSTMEKAQIWIDKQHP